MGKGDSVEVRVQYAHDARMKKPSWQAGYDRERAYLDHWQPIVSLLLLAITVLFTVGGVLFVVLRYLSHGRDPQALVVPTYLSEPPSDERPGVVGLLLDEKADMQDIMATLLDLARRGAGHRAGGEGRNRWPVHQHGVHFPPHRSRCGDLRPYEQSLLGVSSPKGAIPRR